MRARSFAVHQPLRFPLLLRNSNSERACSIPWLDRIRVDMGWCHVKTSPFNTLMGIGLCTFPPFY
jgi:hypothetical protein